MATKRDIKSESTGFQTHGRTKYDLCKRFLIEEVGIRPDQADMCQTTYDLRKRILVEELGSSVIKIMDVRKFVRIAQGLDSPPDEAELIKRCFERMSHQLNRLQKQLKNDGN